MAASAKIRILLADDDALRRDGMAAVLAGRADLEVISKAADGETALAAIRAHRPDVAVVDLNIPKLHGIELVRRIRAEELGTKVIIVSGTADDEIVREVIRAGGDGYLLKNGPARHLFDAISYVQDGGQYFSPQLGRDGRERHLLEEPARTWEQPAAETSGGEQEPETPEQDRLDRGTRAGRARRGRRAERPVSDPGHLRERLRENTPAADLDDRDYEIMTMMADGIRPIIDRLDEIDTRVAQMEVGDAPVPSNPRAWLNVQLEDSLRDPRAGNDVAVIGRSMNDMEARLPSLIEDAVSKRFHQMAHKLQDEIEETHVRTLETFVRNIQVKLVQRVSALEHDMSKQAEAMGQLREYSLRTEDNLSRLISGVDKLARELPGRLAHLGSENPAAEAAAFQAAPPAPQTAPPEPIHEPAAAALPSARAKPRASGRDRSIRMFWAVAGVFALVALLGWGGTKLLSKHSPTAVNEAASAAPAPSDKPKAPAANADTKTKMQAAQEFADRKDYVTAEDIYKQVVQTEPGNVDALKALASVLYRQDKIEESVAVLDKITKN